MRIIKGSKEKTFAIILQLVVDDVNRATKAKMKPEELKEGYAYTKKLKPRIGKEANIRVTIEKLHEPVEYEATFLNSQGLNTLSYTLEDHDDTHFKLVYREAFISDKKSSNMNFSLVSFLYKRSTKKRVNLLLDRLEELVQE